MVKDGHQREVLQSQMNPWLSYELLPNKNNPWLRQQDYGRHRRQRCQQWENTEEGIPHHHKSTSSCPLISKISFNADDFLSIADIEDLDLRVGNEIIFEKIIGSERSSLIIPYAVDFKLRRIIFIEEEEKVFVRALAVTFDHFELVSNILDEAIGDKLSQILFVHSTGIIESSAFIDLIQQEKQNERYGNNMKDILESDVYTCIAREFYNKINQSGNIDNNNNDELYIMLLKGISLYFVYIQFRKQCQKKERKKRSIIVIKMRSCVDIIANLIKLAVPDAKQIYIYQNAINFIDTYASLFLDRRIFGRGNKINKNFSLIDTIYTWQGINQNDFNNLLPTLRLVNDERFEKFKNQQLGIIGVLGMSWLSSIDGAINKDKCVYDFVLRYEDLKRPLYEDAIIGQVFDNCEIEIPQNLKTAIAERTTKDTLEKLSTLTFITPKEIRGVQRLLNCHEKIRHSDFIIGGSLLCQKTTNKSLLSGCMENNYSHQFDHERKRNEFIEFLDKQINNLSKSETFEKKGKNEQTDNFITSIISSIKEMQNNICSEKNKKIQNDNNENPIDEGYKKESFLRYTKLRLEENKNAIKRSIDSSIQSISTSIHSKLMSIPEKEAGNNINCANDIKTVTSTEPKNEDETSATETILENEKVSNILKYLQPNAMY